MTEVLSIKAIPSYSRQIFLPGSQASRSTARTDFGAFPKLRNL
ncbi:hypothetical protein ABIF21_004151 [Bradyrhizobium elkanii]|nr:hypothetical protein [Bradyrhizobium elkanii]